MQYLVFLCLCLVNVNNNHTISTIFPNRSKCGTRFRFFFFLNSLASDQSFKHPKCSLCYSYAKEKNYDELVFK